jgi:hypothetical protein
MNYNSIYKEYADTSIDWCPMDTQELYQLNLKSRYDDLDKFGWIDSKVSYTFNEHGFRCPAFENTPNIMFLGCSHTVGIGINIEDTWAHLASKELNLQCVNLGQGGGTNDTAFRLGFHWIPKLKPKIVFLLQPESTRLEIISRAYDIQFLLAGHPPLVQWKRWYQDWLSVNSNSFLNLQKNTLALAEICRQHRVKFRYIGANAIPQWDKARDLAHDGVISNSKFVPTVLSLIEDPNAHVLKK